MNKKKIMNYQIFSALLVFILGSLFHFTYELSGNNLFIATFSAVNESVWEHLKLIFFPSLLTVIIGILYLKKECPNFICAKTLGILISMAFIVIFFYTYTGIIGKSISIIDISSFIIAVILGESISYLLVVNKFKCNSIISVCTLVVLSICFILFTFFTPQIGIFKDPITGLYGISLQKDIISK